MGLAELVRSAVDTGFSALGNLVETATYTRRTAATYDTATGAVTPTTTTAPVDVVFTDYSIHERENDAILPEDRRAIVKASSISFVPAVGDTLVRAVGGTWTIVDVAVLGPRDAAVSAAAWDLQMRRPG